MTQENHHTPVTFDLFETLAQAFNPNPKPKRSSFLLSGEIYSNSDDLEEDPNNYPNEDLDGRDGQ